MLTKKQRINLRSYAQKLPDVVFVGKSNLTDNILQQIQDNLYCHEIVKIKVQQSSDETLQDMADVIAIKCKCEIVTIIGNKIIVYKYSGKPTNSDNKEVREVLNK